VGPLTPFMPLIPPLQLRNKRFLIEFEFWGHRLRLLLPRIWIPLLLLPRLGCCPRIDVVVARFEVVAAFSVAVAIAQWLTYNLAPPAILFEAPCSARLCLNALTTRSPSAS